MLRNWVLGFGVAALTLAVAVLVFGWMLFPLSIWLGLSGLGATLGILCERRGDKPVENRPPGPGWVETGERFLDPETGKAVTVFHQPASGERRYVAR